MAAATGRTIQATSPRDSFTGVAARSVPVTRTHPLPLPTPPNSISPALPPHGLKAQLQKAAARLDPVDSDLDLQDISDDNGRGNDSNSNNTSAGATADHPRSGVAALAAAAAAAASTSPSPSVSATASVDGAVDRLRLSSPPFESADAISPAMLAKYHLPEILLNHGPLAIRYIIGHLTAAVPGFSFIPPAKSRRLVVAALEGRGSGAGTSSGSESGTEREGGGVGGLEGDVEFQKVSWGVWGARRVGFGGRQQRSPTPQSARLGIPIAAGNGGGGSGNGNGGVGVDRLRQHNQGSGALYQDADLDDGNAIEDEDEVDKMSMSMDDNDGVDDDEGPASSSSSEVPDDDMMAMDDDPDDLTDDEDWGAVGAAALRAASYSNNSATAGRFGSHGFLSSRPLGSFSSFTNFAATADNKQLFSFGAAAGSSQRQSALAANGLSPLAGASDEQEREAIEALLRLGSV